MTSLQKEVAEYSRQKFLAAGASVSAPLTLNTAEYLFLGPLYMGTPIQGNDAFTLWDSSTGYTAVTSTTCGDYC